MITPLQQQWRHPFKLQASPDTHRPIAGQAMCSLSDPDNLWPGQTDGAWVVVDQPPHFIAGPYSTRALRRVFISCCCSSNRHHRATCQNNLPTETIAAAVWTRQWISRMSWQKRRRRETRPAWSIFCKPELKLTGSTVLDEPLFRSVLPDAPHPLSKLKCVLWTELTSLICVVDSEVTLDQTTAKWRLEDWDQTKKSLLFLLRGNAMQLFFSGMFI